MQIERQITIEATPDKVWEVLGPRFDQVDAWASSVDRSTARAGHSQIPGAPMVGRTCETEIGPVKEAITEYDEVRRIVAYSAHAEKMPFFVKDMRNRWALASGQGGRTHVDMRMTAKLSFPFNLFMTPMMKLQMGKLLTNAIEELKFFVENGEPHPRKQKAARAALKAAA